MPSYKDLDIYNTAYKLAVKTHQMSLTLPKYEMYEQGSQVRRSSKSIKDNIAEGFGRRRYKDEFIRFLVFSHASCNEAISQITMINELYFDNIKLTNLLEEYESLGAKINKFIQYVETNWRSPHNPQPTTHNP